MYGGRLVEVGEVRSVFEEPLQPYTRLLISSLPSIERRAELKGIPGVPPSLLDPPPECLFHPRCPEATDRCRRARPPLVEVRAGRRVACFICGENRDDSAA